ncbi:hypothetical protein LPB72_07995 [Hydrogenophaga crassostreae]|uniref:LTD domain-containing protein n=1 Tax=Hydrogenophaga crassostreae TaxID=1763535 RepID=A0A162T1I9_9BURK|nr:hypothetical protein [Hydrogenophaga crassostreae]AOW12377.1 hypothetical protein LPB072_05415 [Hydrogenophaga crassostreae]OAD42427.1 hypothetical protein LPB72_07995 [Hydrogenophaga crassostreae]
MLGWRQDFSSVRLCALALGLSGLVACGGGGSGDEPLATSTNAAVAVGSTEWPAASQWQKAASLNAETLATAAAAIAAGDANESHALSKASARSPVYRFYNTETAAHFYTISLAERDRVRNTMPVFRYEGEAFYVSATADAGLSPVYRFYNLQTGVHFYSISAEEKAFIEANFAQFYYEGIAYYASKTAISGAAPLYRFYVSTKGFHFYSASEAEKDSIRATLPVYLFENVGYYVFPSPSPSASLGFTVGGGLTGLATGQTLVLQNNGGDDLSLSANGGFQFTAPVASEGTYSVSVKTQPTGQVCSVSAGIGVVVADVGSVVVTCSSVSYPVGGSVSGLAVGQSLVLQNNGSGDLSRSSNGAFTFAANVAHGAGYLVTVRTQPAGQSCSVSNGSGTASAAVSGVQVVCATGQYALGGTVSGLAAGQTLVLQNNGGSDLSRSANGGFTFAGNLAHGSVYAVTVKTQPAGQSCIVINGSGTATASVGNVSVNCVTSQYTVGGNLAGMASGKSVVLQNNGGNNLTRTTTGAFTFAGSLPPGSAYSVTVMTQPLGQNCSVSNGSGIVSASVSNVQVLCAVNFYSVGGSISGLGSGKSVTLQNNAGNDLIRTQNGNFGFSQLLTYGVAYAVSVKTQPVDQTCSVANGLDTVSGQVSTVAVTCVDHVSVGGSVSGLGAGNPVVLTLNGAGDLSLGSNGAFTFANKTPLGAAYVVGVKTQPNGQTCGVSNATGTANAAVGNVGVQCVTNALTDLVISEVGSCPSTNESCWFEVFNPTASVRNLSSYSLRAGEWTAEVFALPAMVVAPGQYRVIAARLDSVAPITPLNPVAMVGSTSSVPRWAQSYYTGSGQLSRNGLVELVSLATNTTVDAVRFGNTVAPQPLTAGHWSGPGVVSDFTAESTNSSRALVRTAASMMANQDTQSASDWVIVDYATPGGPNDVAPGSADADNDGLPDPNEMPGATYNGLNLYSMGARVNQRDIFLELDHMDSATVDLVPQIAAMQTLKDVFAAHGFALHIDVGNVFSAEFNPAQFNLGQVSGKVPYEACLGWGVGDCATNSSTHYRTIYDWKWQHFDVRRRAIFHYGLIGNAAAQGEGGRGELFGNDFSVTSGAGGGGNVGVLMHELGHNLGLQHGGDEATQYKPNYLSVMNYLYSWHVPPQGNSVWPFRKWKYSFGNSAGMYVCSAGSTDPNCAAQLPYSFNYSEGGGLPLNESSLYESSNVGRGALPGVYADWDENGSLTANPIARDLNQDGLLAVLTDHNDWAAINLPFVHNYGGQLFTKSAQMASNRKAAKVPSTGAAVPNPLTNDRGPTVITCGPVPASGGGALNKRGQRRNWLSQPGPRQ